MLSCWYVSMYANFKELFVLGHEFYLISNLYIVLTECNCVITFPLCNLNSVPKYHFPKLPLIWFVY